MLFPTHILLGLFTFLISAKFFSGNEILFLIFILLGSILPDIDEKHSKATQWTGLLGKTISFFSKHRGFFHSLFFVVIITSLVKYFINDYLAWGVFLGLISHLLGDALTKQGLPILYPFPFKIKGFLKTNGWGEKVIQVFILTFLVIQLIQVF
tara:strand:+ start:847 stop:1305 length:459 start_codon:yes stop_codon:yes gene_type:complete